MATRAYKYADAVVVPTHAIAAQLDEIIGFGDRVRVIGGAANSQLELPHDAAERATRLALPEQYVLAHGASGRGLASALATLATEAAPSLPLLVTDSDDGLAEAVAAAGLPGHRVVGLGHLAQADLAVVLDRATVLLLPTLGEGFGMPMLDAFRFGLPVVHSDSPSIVELSGGAGLAAPGEPHDLAEALSRVVADTQLAHQLGILGQDRAGVFTWRAVAEQVWQLHADL